MADSERYPEYRVYRGLQKPLEMFGMRGRFVTILLPAFFGVTYGTDHWEGLE